MLVPVETNGRNWITIEVMHSALPHRNRELLLEALQANHAVAFANNRVIFTEVINHLVAQRKTIAAFVEILLNECVVIRDHLRFRYFRNRADTHDVGQQIRACDTLGLRESGLYDEACIASIWI